jgi:hypothetical protein
MQTFTSQKTYGASRSGSKTLTSAVSFWCKFFDSSSSSFQQLCFFAIAPVVLVQLMICNNYVKLGKWRMIT